MPQDAIRVIVFDLGRVLLDFDHNIASRRISVYTKKSAEEIYELFFDSQITRSFEEGKVSSRDFYSRVKDMLGMELGYEEFCRIWNGIFFLTETNKRVRELAARLKKRYQIAVLSNVNLLHYEYIRDNFPVFDIFDRVFASCEMGLVKPDPQIYRKVLESLGVTARQVFYTDDRPELVESARALEIRARIFTGVKQLEEDLKENGIELGR